MGDFFDLIQFKLINSVNYSVWSELAGICCVLQHPWWFAFLHAKQLNLGKNLKGGVVSVLFSKINDDY